MHTYISISAQLESNTLQSTLYVTLCSVNMEYGLDWCDWQLSYDLLSDRNAPLERAFRRFSLDFGPPKDPQLHQYSFDRSLTPRVIALLLFNCEWPTDWLLRRQQNNDSFSHEANHIFNICNIDRHIVT